MHKIGLQFIGWKPNYVSPVKETYFKWFRKERSYTLVLHRAGNTNFQTAVRRTGAWVRPNPEQRPGQAPPRDEQNFKKEASSKKLSSPRREQVLLFSFPRRQETHTGRLLPEDRETLLQLIFQPYVFGGLALRTEK